jgi:hypothetical protein
VGRGRARVVKQRWLDAVRGPAEARLIAANRAAADRARGALLLDSDGFLAYLQGRGPEPDRGPVG